MRRAAAQCELDAPRITGPITSLNMLTAEGMAEAQRGAAGFKKLTEELGRGNRLVTEVSEASRQQAQGIEQVSKALAQMESVTQTTAANAEEGAAASEELSAQAACSQELVDDLRALVVDRKAAAAAAASAPPAAAQRPAAGQTFTSAKKAA